MKRATIVFAFAAGWALAAPMSLADVAARKCQSVYYRSGLTAYQACWRHEYEDAREVQGMNAEERLEYRSRQ
jgi:hypothetical protein